MKTEDGIRQIRPASRNRSPTWCWNSAARCPASMATAWCAARSCGRCSATSLYEAFRDDQAHLRSARHFQSRQNRRLRLRSPRICASAPATKRRIRRPFSISPNTAAWAGAVEMCSGVGACRKTLAGTMCPSYMATRDESATTRGRANALRLAMSGSSSESGLGDDGVYQTCSISAWNAAPAKPSARSAWTWRDSRASFSPITGSATERRCARALWAASTVCRFGEAASLRSPTGSPQARRPAAK